jgi:hypothetical protein
MELVLPLVDGLLFGSIGVAYGQGDEPVRMLVTGILLFHLIWQLTLAGSLGLLEGVWSRNLLNLIATPSPSASSSEPSAWWGCCAPSSR